MGSKDNGIRTQSSSNTDYGAAVHSIMFHYLQFILCVLFIVTELIILFAVPEPRRTSRN